MYESIKEFAERTGFSYSAIRLLCMKGQLPFVKVGRKRMIAIHPALKVLEQLAETPTVEC